MKATTVKLKGILNDSSIIMGGVTFVNHTKIYYAVPVYVYTKIPDLPDGQGSFIVKSYDGPLGSTNGEFQILNVETIGGSVVKTYRPTFTSGSRSYEDKNTHKTYIGRQVRLIDPNNVPWRIDIIGTDIDIEQGGVSADGYSNPYIIDGDQVKYSAIPSKCNIFKCTYAKNAIKTEWFRNNPNLIYIDGRGGKGNIQGSIMDLVTTGHTLTEFNFTLCKGIKGNARDFLNALKDFGVKNHTIEFHITESGITQDVYINSQGEYGGVFDAVFDLNGDWTTRAVQS